MECVPMTDRLVIVQLDAGSEAKVPPGTVILGLSLVRRIVLAAQRAGADRVLVLAPDAGETRCLLEGTSALVAASGEPLPPLPPGRIVLLAGAVLFQVKWLRALFDVPIERERLYAEASLVGVIESDDPRGVLFGGGQACPDVFAAVAKVKPVVPRTFPQEGRCVLGGPQDCRPAEGWLLRGLIKETEGFMSRHVERRISLAISRRLASTSVTPNAMTLFSVGAGLLGAPFFLSSAPAYQVTGALLFLLHSILDGCDGELARLKFQESRWGGVLDFWGDNVVHVAVFMCMGIGWSLAVQAAWPLILGGAAVAGTLLSAGFVYRHTMREQAKPGPLFTSVSKGGRSWLSQVADALARRDFIYLVVLLSAAGKATWFLALAGIGAPIFFLVLLAAAATEARREGRLTA
jgi:phosphatidylglycerophosphate synthase